MTCQLSKYPLDSECIDIHFLVHEFLNALLINEHKTQIGYKKETRYYDQLDKVTPSLLLRISNLYTSQMPTSIKHFYSKTLCFEGNSTSFSFIAT